MHVLYYIFITLERHPHTLPFLFSRLCFPNQPMRLHRLSQMTKPSNPAEAQQKFRHQDPLTSKKTICSTTLYPWASTRQNLPQWSVLALNQAGEIELKLICFSIDSQLFEAWRFKLGIFLGDSSNFPPKMPNFLAYINFVVWPK